MKGNRVLWGVVLLVFLMGCTGYETIEVQQPPRSDIQGVERIGLTNFTDPVEDRGLGEELLIEVSNRLIAESPYTIIQTDMRADDYSLSDARDLNLDALLIGQVTRYHSDTGVDTIDYSEERGLWTIRKKYEITMNTTFRLIDVASGNIIYSRRISDTQTDHARFTVGEDTRQAALEAVRIYLRDETRQLEEKVMENIVDELYRDISPHYVRRRVPRED